MKSMLFHQFQRYEATQILLNSMRTKETHTILEVGSGNHANLEKFLPKDNIKYLDTVLSEENKKNSKFVLGDITEIDLEEDSFDFIISLDVLEHIPASKRDIFLSKISKAVKYGVIISVPTGHVENIYNDKLLDAVFKSIGKEPPIWVHEHEEHGLPSEKDIIDKLESSFGHTCEVFYHGNREMFTLMNYLEALASNSLSMYNFFSILNDYYNNFIFYNDLLLKSNSAAKTFFVSCKHIESQKQARNGILKTILENDFFIQQNIYRIDRFITWFGLLDRNKNENDKIDKLINTKLGDLDNKIENYIPRFEELNGKIDKTQSLLNEMEDRLGECVKLSENANDNAISSLKDMQMKFLNKIEQMDSVLNRITNKMESDEILNKLNSLENDVMQMKTVLNKSICSRIVKRVTKLFNKIKRK